jgi:prepilin-type N-terminal cleavage/methylation domain-containing protein
MNQSTSGPRVRRNRRAAGFSLAEVLVAVALLAVILLALMGLISSGVHRAYSGKKMTEATMLAQAAMERANVYAAHKLLGAADSDTTATQTWTRKGTDTTPAPVSGTTAEAIEQTAWHDLLDNANLPTDTDFPSTLTVTMTPMGATGANFGNATMVRVLVDVTWTEWGSRERQVRLQTLNLRKTP